MVHIVCTCLIFRHVDVIHVDEEYSGWFVAAYGTSFADQRSTITNLTGVWEALAHDPRWPALRDRLNLAGVA